MLFLNRVIVRIEDMIRHKMNLIVLQKIIPTNSVENV